MGLLIFPLMAILGACVTTALLLAALPNARMYQVIAVVTGIIVPVGLFVILTGGMGVFVVPLVALVAAIGVVLGFKLAERAS